MFAPLGLPTALSPLKLVYLGMPAPGGWVTLDEDSAERTWIWTDSDDVALDLANLRDLDDIRAFVATHGLLKTGPGSDDLRESVSDWLEASSAVHAALSMGRNLHYAREPEHDLWLESMDHLRQVGRKLDKDFYDGQKGDAFYYDEAIPEDELTLRRVRKVVSEIVSQGLQGVTFSFGALQEYEDMDARPGDFSLVPQMPDLLTLAYYRTAVMLAGNVPTAICEDKKCQRIFSPRDPRQRYHSTACANRARQRRFAQREASGEKGTSARNH